jgi:hypothetical protein
MIKKIMEDGMKSIKLYKVLFIVGLVIMSTAIFFDSIKVASLSTLKSSDKRIQLELKEKYTLAAPETPLDESLYILAPAAPSKDATQEQKDAYTKAQADYDANVKALKAKYDEAMKSYTLTYKEYQQKQKALDLEKQKNNQSVKKISEKNAKDIELRQLSITEFMMTTFLRFFGSLLLLLGSLGILIFGESYEKLGVLVVIGFSLKTLIGL